MERSFLGNSWKEGASLAREPTCAKEGRHKRMPVGQAGVRHVGEEAELDRGICVPMWVASGSEQFWVEGRQPRWTRPFLGGSASAPEAKHLIPRAQRGSLSGASVFSEHVCWTCRSMHGQISFHVLASSLTIGLLRTTLHLLQKIQKMQ